MSAIFTQIAIVLSTLVAATLAAHLGFDLAGRLSRRYAASLLERGSQKFAEIFVFIDARQLFTITIVLALVLGLISYLLFGWFVALVALAITLATPRLVLNHLRKRRIRRFDLQLVDALAQMASALRAGLSFPQAADSLAQDAESPLADEFRLLTRELRLGVSQQEALDNLAGRVNSDNLRLLVTSTNLSHKLGGNLAEIYDGISLTVRERFELEGRVEALTAMARLQAWVVGSMPIGMGIAFNMLRPDLMEPMLASGFGKAIIAAVIALEITGIWLVRKLMVLNV